ncbi:hypothetical protein BDV23DRAFT_160079 [Aspergillus alliaceus]|uniref:Uncharacterized protein n=1 Tax=Petromyces alliaceus TaxID=209559 RepID=A0A5N7C1L8_PETAA|nr:hypothetical protein BDV23DRAFT_160079 [Aspergillus alliaceus]
MYCATCAHCPKAQASKGHGKPWTSLFILSTALIFPLNLGPNGQSYVYYGAKRCS